MKTWFKGIRGRLLIAACLPVLALVIVIGISMHASNKLGGLLEDSYTRMIPNMDSFIDIMSARSALGYYFWAAYSNASANPDLSKEFINKAKVSSKELREGIAKYEAAPFDPAEEKMYSEIKGSNQRFYDLTEQIIAAFDKGDAESLKLNYDQMATGEWHALAEKMKKTFDPISTLYTDEGKEGMKTEAEVRAFSKNLLFFTGLLAIFSIFSILMWIAYRVSNSVGDVATKLSDSTGQVTQAIEQLSAAGHALSESSTESAASLEETVASLEEMTSMVQMNSDHAREAAALAQTSRDSAEKGEKEIQTLVESMQGISQASKKTKKSSTLLMISHSKRTCWR